MDRTRGAIQVYHNKMMLNIKLYQSGDSNDLMCLGWILEVRQSANNHIFKKQIVACQNKIDERGHSQCHNDPKIICDNVQHQDASTNGI